MSRLLAWTAMVAAVVTMAACGAVEPTDDEDLTVEAFAHSGSQAPEIVVRRTANLHSGDAHRPAEDAQVELEIDGAIVKYENIGGGRYRPVFDAVTPPGASVEVVVNRGPQQLTGSSSMPPVIAIDSVAIEIAPEPVEAVLIDTLSLAPGASVTGFLYMIEVSFWWRESSSDGEWYVRAQLRADPSVAPLVIDLFLRSDQTIAERSLPVEADGRKRWTGVYAVNVETRESQLPVHPLRISLLRSGRDYARFAWSRDSPDRREPEGNVTGGIGIVAGISVDSLNLVIEPSADL